MRRFLKSKWAVIVGTAIVWPAIVGVWLSPLFVLDHFFGQTGQIVGAFIAVGLYGGWLAWRTETKPRRTESGTTEGR